MDEMTRETKVAADRLGLSLKFEPVRGPEDFDATFSAIGADHPDALFELPSPLLFAERVHIAALAVKHRLPAMYYLREFVDEGGLMAYGPDFTGLWRRAAEYVDKILKGAKPSDLPIEQPTKFQLVVNLKTAKTLGITIPESILVRADEVIR